MPRLDRTAAMHFREELRVAREAVSLDAEQFVAIIHVIERLGSFLDPVPGEGGPQGLGRYGMRIARSVVFSPLASGQPPWRSDFFTLYDAVREARNDAIHQGAFARHLASNSVKLAIVLEDALLTIAHAEGLLMDTIDVYMVKQPDCACLWQPISFLRQTMLENSFSFLPLFDEATKAWKLVSDYEVAKFLDGEDRRNRLAILLKDAVGGKDGRKLDLIPTKHFFVTDSKSTVLQGCEGYPVVVVHDKDVGLALGIVTPFDLI